MGRLRSVPCGASLPGSSPSSLPAMALPPVAFPSVPPSCHPLPVLGWSLRGLFPVPSSGPPPLPRGNSLKPAMSTVQAAGRSLRRGQGGRAGRPGQGRGSRELKRRDPRGRGGLVFLRTPAHRSPPSPRYSSRGCIITLGSFCCALWPAQHCVLAVAGQVK